MSSNDLFSNKPLNILKASLPYVPSTMQKVISYYIKIEEFNIMRNSFNTSHDNLLSACDNGSDNNHKNKPIELINAVKPYLNTEEKNLIDMVNAFNMYNTYKSLNLPALRPESFNFNNPDGPVYNSGNKSDASNIENDSFINGTDYDNDNPNNKQSNSSPDNIPANIDIDALKNMLSPSQRAMFDTYSSLLNKNK